MQTMKKLFLILSVAAGLVSCEDFLTAGDPNKIDAPSYFRNESDLEAYANGFLQTMIPTAISVATGDARADYMAWRGEWQYLTDNFDADDQSGWSTGSWEDLRNINYFLGNFRRAAAGEAILDHYEGVARFWRAYFYMNKVKTFGAVPWYDREIDANDREALYKPRDSREYVMRSKTSISPRRTASPTPSSKSIRCASPATWRWPSRPAAVSTKALSANTTRTIPRPASRGRPTSRRCTSGPAPTPAKR